MVDLIDHAGLHLLRVKVAPTSDLLHVLEVHQLEGVLVGAAAAHHGVDLGSTLLGSGQREY